MVLHGQLDRLASKQIFIWKHYKIYTTAGSGIQLFSRRFFLPCTARKKIFMGDGK
jgi:hypothetical protein